MSLYEFGGWGEDIFSCLFILFKFRTSVRAAQSSPEVKWVLEETPERAVVRGTGAVQRETPSFA